MMAWAPRMVKNIPDFFRRLAITVRQAASMTPEPTKSFWRKSGGTLIAHWPAFLIRRGLCEDAAYFYFACVRRLISACAFVVFGRGSGDWHPGTADFDIQHWDVVSRGPGSSFSRQWRRGFS